MPKSYRANGDIRPSRFVEILTADDSVTESDANDPIFGISQEFPRDTPIDGASGNAAAAGDDLLVYVEGDECLLECGDNVTRGNLLQSDADGKGIPVASTAATIMNTGAIALESGASVEFIRVKVRLDKVTNPA